MNFNKDYPIAILDTNIVMDVPNILSILKGCNIVIPYTLIEELDNHKKENKGARDFVNNFLALSEKANLSKDGYKLENDCMLYLDMDKNNLIHKEIDLDSKKQDIKFIAEAKNIKEKYNYMTVVLLTSDKIMKITASTFDVKAKNLEEFIMEYLKLDINELYELAEKYNYTMAYFIIYKTLSENKDMYGLYELAKNIDLNNSDNETIYKAISIYLYDNKNINIDELYKFAKNIDLDNSYKKAIYKELFKSVIYKEIFKILSDNKDMYGLYELTKNIDLDNDLDNLDDSYKKTIYKAITTAIFQTLSYNKDIDGLLAIVENSNLSRETIVKAISNVLSDIKDISCKLEQRCKGRSHWLRNIMIDVRRNNGQNLKSYIHGLEHR